jgi:hypothetical protein
MRTVIRAPSRTVTPIVPLVCGAVDRTSDPILSSPHGHPSSRVRGGGASRTTTITTTTRGAPTDLYRLACRAGPTPPLTIAKSREKRFRLAQERINTRQCKAVSIRSSFDVEVNPSTGALPTRSGEAVVSATHRPRATRSAVFGSGRCLPVPLVMLSARGLRHRLRLLRLVGRTIETRWKDDRDSLEGR